MTMDNTLGVYIHIPFCARKCAYCDFLSGNFSDKIQDEYFQALYKEISEFDFDNKIVDTIYFGGGNPSLPNPQYIADVVCLLKDKAYVADDAEITIESNPESFTCEKAKIYANAGINRISFGLQTTNNDILKILGRGHSVSDFFTAVDSARKYFTNISADLMIGLPSQGIQDVRQSVEDIVDIVDHLSLYALKIEKGTKFYNDNVIVDDDKSADFYDFAHELLLDSGFNRYEVSNFAKAGKDCLHNIKYWTLCDYKGFGLGAHSYVCGNRLENTRSMNDYTHGVNVVSSQPVLRGSDEDIAEYIMLGLRLERGISLSDFYARFGYKLEQAKRDEILSLSKYVSILDDRLFINKDSFYVMNAIILKLI